MNESVNTLPTIDKKMIIPVILSGGSGSRLWPVSRKTFPKQFWPLISEWTLLQETALRAHNAHVAAPYVVCNADHRFIVAEQLREAKIHDAQIILEPTGRNSAPAIAAAAFLIEQKFPETVLWIMAADAAIKEENALLESLQRAVSAAQKGYIATFGVKPDKPETGYGYIQCGTPLKGLKDIFHVERFLEKPSKKQAQELIQDKNNLWNSGMFVAKAKTLLEEIKNFVPDVYEAVYTAVTEHTTDMDFIRLAPKSFASAPDISIDYAVAEKTKLAVVVPCDLGWSDIGSWDALWEFSSKDDDGNATYGDVFLDGVKNSYVRSDGIVVTVTGVDDLIVVVTKDSVMVSHRNRAQDVKKVVERLKEAKRPEATSHNRVYRPWGFYESLTHRDRFQVKHITVNPGQKLSLQKHFHRAEHWVVVTGTAIVTRGEEKIMVRENESIYLPLGEIHRLENPGKIPLSLIEVQSGSYLGEDDIVRIEDIYARV